jgi:hypothetical protein
MTDTIFPFHVYNYDNFSGAGPSDFRDTFLKNKPKRYMHTEGHGKYAYTHERDFHWYCYEVIVHSQTKIEFVCFDMEDTVYGGKGKEFHRFVVIVDKNVTKNAIKRKLIERAARRRDEELLLAERMLIQSYADREAVDLGIEF